MPQLVSIVIPVYFNEATLERTCAAVAAVLEAIAEVNYEFVCVNDGSRDGSWAELLRLRAAAPAGRFRLVNLVQNYGQRSALLAGYRAAQGDCVVSISADMQDPPELIRDFIEAWRDGHSLVAGVRVRRNDGWLYDAVAGAAWRLLRKVALPNIPNGGFDFFLMDRRVRDRFVEAPEQGLFIQGRLLHLAGAPHLIPYERRARRDGRSRTSLGRRLAYFIDGIAGYSYLPLRLMSLVGLLVFFTGLTASVYIAWHVLRHGSRVEGWASLAIMLLILNGLQMLFMGIMGEYLWRNLEESRRRPHYVVDRVLE